MVIAIKLHLIIMIKKVMKATFVATIRFIFTLQPIKKMISIIFMLFGNIFI